MSLALLTAKIHGKTDYETMIEENTKSLGKEIRLNTQDIENIKQKITPIVPLKPIINIRNKQCNRYLINFLLDHSNFVTHIEIKRNQQSNIDNILNQNENDGVDNINTQTTENKSVFNQFLTGEKTEEPPKEIKKKNINTSKWADEEEEDDEEIKRILEEKSKNAQFEIKSLTIADDDIIQKGFVHSSLPGIQVALGNFKMAINYLKSQLAICSNYESLRRVIKDVYMSSYSQVRFMPYIPPLEFNLRQTKSGKILPQNGVSLRLLENMLNVSLYIYFRMLMI